MSKVNSSDQTAVAPVESTPAQQQQVARHQQEPVRGGSYVRAPATGEITEMVAPPAPPKSKKE